MALLIEEERLARVDTQAFRSVSVLRLVKKLSGTERLTVVYDHAAALAHGTTASLECGGARHQ